MVSEKNQRQQLYAVVINNGLGGGCKEGPALSTPEGIMIELGNTAYPLTT